MSLDFARLCGVCAWRGTCQKKFSLPHDALHCPDFSRDVTIKPATATKDTEKETEKSHK